MSTLETARLAVDAISLIDPTPLSNIASAAISVADGDWAGAALSIAAIGASVTLVGDEALEAAKARRSAKALADSADGATGALKARADEIHGKLDDIAQTKRRTAVAQSTDGSRVVGSGGRDLSPAQRKALAPGEEAAKKAGAHAEVTVLDHMAVKGMTPEALAVSHRICPQCIEYIQERGGTLTSATTAVWPK